MSTVFISSLTRQTREALAAAGLQADADLVGVHIPDLLDAGVSWGQVHKIIKYLTAGYGEMTFLKPDDTWTNERWQEFVASLTDAGILTWEDVAVCVLGELNPPQVGTSLASNTNIKSQYAPRKAMRAVMEWFYAQDGRCQNCGRRIHIEVDHIKGKNEFILEGRSPDEADTLGNLQLLCRRCNVIKRESHALGGLSFATAQAALMWILLVERPKNLKAFEALCRRHGLTMADIRFEEAWAMAIWLAKAGEYELDEPIESSIEEAAAQAEADAGGAGLS
jgi:hypothetical protein